MYEEWMEGPPNGFTLQAGMIRPASRGTIRLRSTDIWDELLIDANVLRCEADVDSLEAAVTLCREIASAPALAAWGTEERYPGPSVTSRADLRDYVRRTAITYHHQSSTCRMGVDNGSAGRPAAPRPRCRRPPRGGRVDHADRDDREHQRAVHHDRGARRGLRRAARVAPARIGASVGRSHHVPFDKSSKL